MISYVAKIISLFAATVQSVFHVAWVIGKLIVSVLTGISFALLNIIENVTLFCQIVYEDNIPVFTEELPTIATYVINIVSEQCAQLQNGVLFVFNGISFKVSAIYTTIKWFVDAVVLIVCEVLLLFKNTVIFVGDTLWFILTFIPVHLPLLLRAVFRNVTDMVVSWIVDSYMALLKVTNFLTDVPLESFIGLTSTIVIVRLCVHFKDSIQSQLTTLYWAVVRKVWYYYYAFYNYFIDPEVREITRMSGGQEIRSRDIDQSPPLDDENASDALCVICQERQKCVLTLPCRHVCLCTECCMRLYGYQRTCPICRTFIYHSVTVYL